MIRIGEQPQRCRLILVPTTERPGTEPVACPLERVEAKVRLVAEMGQVELTQVYRNATERAMEARYRMPLPVDAAVTGFSATLGDRTVEGTIEEREAAAETYRKALAKGDGAFLLESLGADAFDVALGNLGAGETCEIRIRYLQTVPWTDGEYRFLLPTVLAPRYDADGSAEGRQPFLGDAEYRLRLDATIGGAGEVLQVKSPSHAVKLAFEDGTCRAELRSDALLDSDLVLRYRIAAEDRRAVLARGERGTFAYARLTVAEDASPTGVVPREYVFVVDASGSMSGLKIEQAKRAVALCLRSLVAGDRFQVVAFGSGHVALFRKAEPYGDSALEEAERFLDAMPSLGGTEILAPLQEILALPPAGGLERVVMLFTDGEVGNEREVVDLVRKKARGLRLFPFGIDTAVNKAFIDGLAEAGNGLPEYIYPGEAIEDKVLRQFARVATPALEDVRLETVSGGVARPFPREGAVGLPAFLHAGESATFAVRLPEGEAPEGLRLLGVLDGSPFAHDVALVAVEDDGTVGRWWARGRIRAMEERREPEEADAIVALSKEFQVLSERTSFVMTLERRDAKTGKLLRVRVPNNLPSGWEEPEEFRMFSANAVFSQSALAMPMSAPPRKRNGKLMMPGIVESEILASRDSYLAEPPVRVGSAAMPDDGFDLNDAVMALRVDGSVEGDAERTAALALAMMLSPDAKKYRGHLRKCLAWLAACGSTALVVRMALWAGAAKGFAKTAPAPADDRERAAQQALEDRDAAVLAALLGVPARDEEGLVQALAEKARHG